MNWGFAPHWEREIIYLWQTHASPLVPGEWACECGGPLGLAGHSVFSRWVQVSSQCSPQHLPSLFTCWWLYGMKGICLSGSRKASNARPSKSHTAAGALCGAPHGSRGDPTSHRESSFLAPTANDAHAYSVHLKMQYTVQISDSCAWASPGYASLYFFFSTRSNIHH